MFLPDSFMNPMRPLMKEKSKKLLIKVLAGTSGLVVVCCLLLVVFAVILPDGAEEPEFASRMTAVTSDSESESVGEESGRLVAPKAEDTATPEPSLTALSIPELTATAVPSMIPTEPSIEVAASVPDGDLATVIEIVDGDTIKVLLDGARYSVRYIGMDTPERGEPFFAESTAANGQLVEGQQVVLVKDVSETDRYNRLLRYVYLPDGTFVNAELVKQGYAVIATFPPDVRHQDLFLKLEREARETGRGLWAQSFINEPAPSSLPLTNTPAPAPTDMLSPTNVPQPTEQTNCDPAYPTVCIPPSPPDLDCGDIPYRNFTVLSPDPHRFDGDNDGVGCES